MPSTVATSTRDARPRPRRRAGRMADRHRSSELSGCRGIRGRSSLVRGLGVDAGRDQGHPRRRATILCAPPAGKGRQRSRGRDRRRSTSTRSRRQGRVGSSSSPSGSRPSRPRTDERRGEEMSRFEDPVIITCSISGTVANRDQCPAIPYTPEEYAAEARRIVDEGGSMIHIHARTPDGAPSYEVEDFRNITDAILSEVDDVIINYSTGAVGVPIEKRLEYLRALRPEVARAEHGLDELREVLAAAQGLRLPDRVRELLRDDHDLPAGDERARHQARARVLRLRPRRATSTRCSTWACCASRSRSRA